MEEDVCYICYEPESSTAPFCKPPPCICKGSIHIHTNCLVTLRRGGSDKCGICKTTFTNTSPGYYHCDINTRKVTCINEHYLRHVYNVNMDNLIHGPLHIYYPSGRLHSTYEYIYGEISGIMKAFYDIEGSPLKQTVRYIASKMDGELLLYNSDNSLHKRINYKLGVLNGPLYIYEKYEPLVKYYRDGVEVVARSWITAPAVFTEIMKSAPAALPTAEYDPLAGILITN